MARKLIVGDRVEHVNLQGHGTVNSIDAGGVVVAMDAGYHVRHVWDRSARYNSAYHLLRLVWPLSRIQQVARLPKDAWGTPT